MNRAVTNDAQFRSTYGTGTPAEVELKEVDWDASGKRQNEEAIADGLVAQPRRGRRLGPAAPRHVLLRDDRGQAVPGVAGRAVA